MFDTPLPFCAKSCFLAALTVSQLLLQSYSSTTNRSTMPRQLSVTLSGLDDSSRNALVTSGYFFHVSQQVFLPRPTNVDTVSQPENAWNMGKAPALAEPKAPDSSWAEM